MPSRASTSLLPSVVMELREWVFQVSMPSRASTSLLPASIRQLLLLWLRCQCPHGLVPHCYEDKHLYALINLVCQCPHGLVPHCYTMSGDVSAEFNNVSMPSRASTSLLQIRLEAKRWRLQAVSMPSRASTSLLQYPLKNLGFMRFPEPVFAGICQNILTVTVFRAC